MNPRSRALFAVIVTIFTFHSHLDTSISLDSTFLNWLRVHQASISHQMAELNVNIAEVYLA